MDAWMHGCMDARVHGWMDGLMDGCLSVCLSACLPACLAGCLSVCLCVSTYVRMYAYMHACMHMFSISLHLRYPSETLQAPTKIGKNTVFTGTNGWKSPESSPNRRFKKGASLWPVLMGEKRPTSKALRKSSFFKKRPT